MAEPFIMDGVLFALRIALTTYLKKIAEKPSDITTTVSMGITIDHALSMTIPIFSGWVWEHWGYRWVFIIATCIAICRVRVDFPMPGSPPMSTMEPGTIPPPSTRANSSI